MKTNIHLAAFQAVKTSTRLVPVSEGIEYIQDCVLAANAYYLDTIKAGTTEAAHATVKARLD